MRHFYFLNTINIRLNLISENDEKIVEWRHIIDSAKTDSDEISKFTNLTKEKIETLKD